MLAVVGLMFTPLDLAALHVADARHLDGRAVVVTLQADAPAIPMAGFTITGPGDLDGVERSVFFPDTVTQGERLVVAGVLRLIVHPPDGRFPGFTEVRITDARRWPN